MRIRLKKSWLCAGIQAERAFGAVVRAGGAFSDCRLHHCLHPFAQLPPRIYEQ